MFKVHVFIQDYLGDLFLFFFLFIKFAFFFSSCFLVLLVFRHQIIHVGLGLKK